MLWVNQYPVDNDSMINIQAMFHANIKERCDKEEENFDTSRIFVNGAAVSESPFPVPAGDIAGVYWWEYLD